MDKDKDEQEKKPVTAATRSEPAEEFIDASNQPSVPKSEAEKGVRSRGSEHLPPVKQ